MKALFLVAIIANFISIVSNLSITAYCIALRITRCAIIHGVVIAFCSEYDAPFTMVAEWDKFKKRGDRRTIKAEKIKERLYFNGTMDEYMELMNP